VIASVAASLTPEAKAAFEQFRKKAANQTPLTLGKLTSKAESEAEEEQNREDRKIDRALKEKTHSAVFLILKWQIGGLFCLMLLQGWKIWGFTLNEWAFGVFLNGTLVQTYFLVRFIVEHLYPKRG
jgi:hypothetical protein